jgi:CRP-like cAMP-binding protein
MTELQKHIHQQLSISPADCQKVSELFKKEHLKKGNYFLQSGKYCNKLSFIQEGILRISTHTQDKEVTQWIATKGYFLTDVHSFLYRSPSRFSMQALTGSDMYTIDYEEYLMLGKLVPKWNEFEKMFIGKCFVMLENRVLDLISLSSEKRYEKLLSQQPELFDQVPLQYLASMLGMTPETFSRIRKKFAS